MIETYQLGAPRRENEGLRIAVVRRLPRGIRKADFVTGGYLDV